MNNRNRHIQYRRSVYKKRKIKTAIIITAVAAVLVLFLLFVIIGNMLNNSISESKNTDDDYFFEETEDDNKLPTAPAIQAYPLPLLEDGSSFSARLDAIGEDAGAVCINLNRPDGTLLFRSEIASSLAGVQSANDASLLSSSVSAIEASGFYTSGVLYVTAFEEENSLLLDVRLAEIGAVACEAIRNGVGDVLLIAPSLDPESLDTMCGLADRIRTTEPEAVVGLVLSDAVYNAENRIALIDKLSEHYSYLCLDTTTNGETDVLEYIDSKISDMQLDIMYYKMRVLLPSTTDTKVQAEYIEMIRKYNISSWQILP